MASHLKRPVVVEPDSDDEFLHYKKQKLSYDSDTSSVASARSNLSALEAAVVSVLASERLKDVKTEASFVQTPLVKPARPAVIPPLKKRRIAMIPSILDAVSDTNGNVKALLQMACDKGKMKYDTEQQNLDKWLMPALGPLPSGRPLLAPPPLPMLKSGHRLTSRKSV